MEITNRRNLSLAVATAILVSYAGAQTGAAPRGAQPAPAPRAAQTAAPSPAAGQTAGRVSAVIPKASRNGQTVQAREPLAWNDVLKTDKNGRLRVSLEDGSILALGGNSQMRVTQHNPAAQQTTVELAFGNLRSTVASLTQPGARFEVRTPTAVAGVLGTDFITLATMNNTVFRCFSGQLNITTNFGSVILNAGQFVAITPTGMGTPTNFNVQGQGGGGQGGQGGQGGGNGGGGGGAGGGAGGAGGAGGGLGGAAGGLGGAVGAAAGVAASSTGASNPPTPASPQ